jgi:hypothetical protein
MIHYRKTTHRHDYYYLKEIFTALCGEVVETKDSSNEVSEVTCDSCFEAVTCNHLEEEFENAKLRARRGLKDVKELAQQINEVVKVDRRRQKREAAEENEEPTVPGDWTYVGLGADYAGVDDAVFREAERYETRWNSIDCDEWTHELQLRGKHPDWSTIWVLQMNIKDGMWDP